MYSYDRKAAADTKRVKDPEGYKTQLTLAAKSKKLQASIKVLEVAIELLEEPETLDPKLLSEHFHSNVKMYNKDIEKAARSGSNNLSLVMRHQRLLLEYLQANLD